MQGASGNQLLGTAEGAALSSVIKDPGTLQAANLGLQAMNGVDVTKGLEQAVTGAALKSLNLNQDQSSIANLGMMAAFGSTPLGWGMELMSLGQQYAPAIFKGDDLGKNNALFDAKYQAPYSDGKLTYYTVPGTPKNSPRVVKDNATGKMYKNASAYTYATKLAEGEKNGLAPPVAQLYALKAAKGGENNGFGPLITDADYDKMVADMSAKVDAQTGGAGIFKSGDVLDKLQSIYALSSPDKYSSPTVDAALKNIETKMSGGSLTDPKVRDDLLASIKESFGTSPPANLVNDLKTKYASDVKTYQTDVANSVPGGAELVAKYAAPGAKPPPVGSLDAVVLAKYNNAPASVVDGLTKAYQTLNPNAAPLTFTSSPVVAPATPYRTPGEVLGNNLAQFEMYADGKNAYGGTAKPGTAAFAADQAASYEKAHAASAASEADRIAKANAAQSDVDTKNKVWADDQATYAAADAQRQAAITPALAPQINTAEQNDAAVRAARAAQGLGSGIEDGGYWIDPMAKAAADANYAKSQQAAADLVAAQNKAGTDKAATISAADAANRQATGATWIDQTLQEAAAKNLDPAQLRKMIADGTAYSGYTLSPAQTKQLQDYTTSYDPNRVDAPLDPAAQNAAMAAMADANSLREQDAATLAMSQQNADAATKAAALDAQWQKDLAAKAAGPDTTAQENATLHAANPNAQANMALAAFGSQTAADNYQQAMADYQSGKYAASSAAEIAQNNANATHTAEAEAKRAAEQAAMDATVAAQFNAPSTTTAAPTPMLSAQQVNDNAAYAMMGMKAPTAAETQAVQQAAQDKITMADAAKAETAAKNSAADAAANAAYDAKFNAPAPVAATPTMDPVTKTLQSWLSGVGSAADIDGQVSNFQTGYGVNTLSTEQQGIVDAARKKFATTATPAATPTPIPMAQAKP
jgi:hypothetical protein